MIWQSRVAVLVLGFLIVSRTASAAPLPPGGLLFPVPSTPFGSYFPIEGVVLAEQTSPFASATYSGTLRSIVLQGDPENPFPDGLTFLYALSNQAGTDSINRLSINGFQGFGLDVSFQFEPVIAPGQPAYVDRQLDGSAIGFSFDAIGGNLGPLSPGDSSRLLVVKTNSTSWTQSSAFVLNGFPAGAAAFAPVPEPSALALVTSGLGLALYLLFRRVRRPA